MQTLTPELAQQFNASAGEGVVVTAVERGSVAAMAGIDASTVILQVDLKPVQDDWMRPRSSVSSPRAAATDACCC